MAILIEAAKPLVIVEPVKCGTKWLRRAVVELGIPHRILEPAPGYCDTHSPADKYPHPEAYIVGMVRHPVSWLISLWRHFSRVDRDMFPFPRQYPHSQFWPVDLDWPTYVDRVAELRIVGKGAISWYFDHMSRGATRWIRQERLEGDLAHWLQEAGLDVTVERLQSVPRENVSRPWPVTLSSEIVQAIMRAGLDVVKRYYGGAIMLPNRKTGGT